MPAIFVMESNYCLRQRITVIVIKCFPMTAYSKPGEGTPTNSRATAQHQDPTISGSKQQQQGQQQQQEQRETAATAAVVRCALL